MAQSAEFLDVLIAYTFSLKGMLQQIGIELGVVARPRYRSDIDNASNAMSA